MLLSAAACALSSIGLARGWLSEIENRTWDARARAVARLEIPHPRVKIIAVDQSSLANQAADGNAWPWPRSMYKPVLTFLARGGAAAAAFDIIFSESGSFGVEDDKSFAQTVAESPFPVISATAAESRTASISEADNENKLLARLQAMPMTRAWRQLLGSGADVSGQTLRAPYPELLAASQGFGMVNGEADADGLFRHYVLGFKRGNLRIPSLAAALTASAVRGRDITPPEGAAGSRGVMLRFFGPKATIRTYAVGQIIESERRLESGEKPLIAPEEFRDAVVLVGYTAPELQDLRPAPVANDMPGVEVHATAVDNLLTGRVVRQAPLALTALMTLAAALIAAAAVLFFSSVTRAVLAAALAGTLLWLAGYAAAAAAWWLPVVWPLLSLSAATLAALGVQYHQEGRAHRFIRNVFRHYVSPAVIEQIIRDPRALALGGERRELSIFFSDVAGFTTISEQLPAEQLAQLLTRLLSAMSDVIQARGGTVDKYVGDAIVAFWNAPLNQSDHALSAVQAALDCQEKLRAMNSAFKRDFGLELRLRIGIHTGMVSVGNFGSHDRFNYTVVGDTANLASRLEGANKAFGTNVLISESTHAALGGRIPARKLGAVRVVGRREPVAVYEPGETLDGAARVQFEQARILFEAGKRAEAAKLFAVLTHDFAAKAYLKRIEHETFAAEAVWNLSEK